MTEHMEPGHGRQPRKWWRLYVHKVQKKYAAFVEIRDREALERKALQQCYDAMRTQPAAAQGLLKQIEAALQDGERIEAGERRARWSMPWRSMA